MPFYLLLLDQRFSLNFSMYNRVITKDTNISYCAVK